jgi:hypothetical protein
MLLYFLEYLTAIWYIWRPPSIFCRHLVNAFSPVLVCITKKIWQPWFQQHYLRIWSHCLDWFTEKIASTEKQRNGKSKSILLQLIRRPRGGGDLQKYFDLRWEHIPIGAKCCTANYLCHLNLYGLTGNFLTVKNSRCQQCRFIENKGW